MTTHATVRVRSPWGWANIDRGIAGLVRAIWRLGIETHCSCEDCGSGGWGKRREGLAQIGFPTFEDASSWLQAVRPWVVASNEDPESPRWTLEGTPWASSDGKMNAATFVYFPRALTKILECWTRGEGKSAPRIGPRHRQFIAYMSDADDQSELRQVMSMARTNENGGATKRRRGAAGPTNEAADRAASDEPSTSTQNLASEEREESSSSASPANTRRKRDRVLRRNARKGGSGSRKGGS